MLNNTHTSHTHRHVCSRYTVVSIAKTHCDCVHNIDCLAEFTKLTVARVCVHLCLKVTMGWRQLQCTVEHVGVHFKAVWLVDSCTV